MDVPVVEEERGGNEMEVDPKVEKPPAPDAPAEGGEFDPSVPLTRQSTRVRVAPEIFTAGEARPATVSRKRKKDSDSDEARKRAKDSGEDGAAEVETEISDEEEEEVSLTPLLVPMLNRH